MSCSSMCSCWITRKYGKQHYLWSLAIFSALRILLALATQLIICGFSLNKKMGFSWRAIYTIYLISSSVMNLLILKKPWYFNNLSLHQLKGFLEFPPNIQRHFYPPIWVYCRRFTWTILSTAQIECSQKEEIRHYFLFVYSTRSRDRLKTLKYHKIR